MLAATSILILFVFQTFELCAHLIDFLLCEINIGFMSVHKHKPVWNVTSFMHPTSKSPDSELFRASAALASYCVHLYSTENSFNALIRLLRGDCQCSQLSLPIQIPLQNIFKTNNIILNFAQQFNLTLIWLWMILY